jgi:hypothetical protein
MAAEAAQKWPGQRRDACGSSPLPGPMRKEGKVKKGTVRVTAQMCMMVSFCLVAGAGSLGEGLPLATLVDLV